MQKIFFFLLMLTAGYSAKAQWEFDSTDGGNQQAVMAAREQDRLQSLQPKPWFFGGGIIANFGTYGSAFGISPLVGYQINEYVDAGLGVNVIYNSIKPDYAGASTGEKFRAWNFGVAPFVRAFPVNFLFTQLQFEQAWVTGNYRTGGQKYNYHYDYQSLIASLGYAQRMGGRAGFYFSVGIDLLNDPNSPYREGGKIKPVFGTGINF